MRSFAIFLLFLLSVNLYGQEFNITPKPAIPALNPTVKPPVLAPKTEVPAIKKTDDSPLVNTKPLNMYDEKNFANPNEQYDKRLTNKASEVGPPVRKKQSLGTVKTKFEKVIVRYRDSQDVDGDQIMISRNGEVIARRVTLDGGFNGFEVRLETGYNYLDFKALDEGDSGPATAQYEVLDPTGHVILSTFWDLSAGDTASLVIIREK